MIKTRNGMSGSIAVIACVTAWMAARSCAVEIDGCLHHEHDGRVAVV
jgi:hypothetical protein